MTRQSDKESRVLLAVPYDIGLVIAFFVYGSRAGFGSVGAGWREFLAGNLTFFATLIGKAFAWPIVLVVWLAQGRQPSPWRAITEHNGRPVRAVVRTSALQA